MKTQHTTERGFTLLEVLVAMLILSVGMLGVGTLLTTSLTLDRRATGEKNAQILAIDKVEYLRKQRLKLSSGADNPELAVGNYGDYGDAPDTATHVSEAQDARDSQFARRRLVARRWTISRFMWVPPIGGATIDSGLLQLDIVVGWPVNTTNCTSLDTSGCKRRLEMTTFFRAFQ